MHVSTALAESFCTKRMMRACNIIKQMFIDIEDREKMHEKMYSLLPIITRAQKTMKNKLAFKIGKLKGLYKLWDRIYWKISLKA